MEPKSAEAELKRMDQLIAVHVFGYRWFLYPAQPERQSFPDNLPEQSAYCSLQVPAGYQARHGAKRVDNPPPGYELDIDIPKYHEDESQLAALMEKCLERDSEHPLELCRIGDHFPYSYCFGDIQKAHYPTIPMALCAYVIRLFKLESCPTYP